MELNAQEMRREFELQHGCLACGGTLVVRVTPGVARAVCRSCRTFSAMRVVASEDGVSIVNRPAAAA
jgi:transcription elongation factor Elf1